MAPETIQLIEYADAHAPDFKRINEEWIREMFTLEPIDQAVLDDPRGKILAGGGRILLVEAPGRGIVGAGALMRTDADWFELTKMGVLKSARGLGAGDFLLQGLIRTARELGVANLYLLTNRRCEAAIHLYEKHGFAHDPEIMEKFGCEYRRCDVAMRYRG